MKRPKTTPLFLSPTLGLVLALSLAGCASVSTPPPGAEGTLDAAATGDLTPYLSLPLGTQAVPLKTNLLAVNAAESCGSLVLRPVPTASGRLDLEYGEAAGISGLDIGSTLSGSCGGAPVVPASVTGDSYALITSRAKTLFVPRFPAPFGLGVEQVANLSAQAATLSYSRRGTPATRLQTVNAGAVGGLFLDLNPAETTFFFRDPATQALIARGTFVLQPGDSVAVLLVGGATKHVVVASSRVVVEPGYYTPGVLNFGANRVAELSFDSRGQGYADFAPAYNRATLGVYPLPKVGTVTRFLLISSNNAASATRFTVAGPFLNPLPAKSVEVNVTASTAYLASVSPSTSKVDPAPTDLKLNSVIPFANRRWEILNPSGELGSTAPAPAVGAASIDQNGLFSPPAEPNGQYRVRVTNRNNPSQYAETIIEVADQFLP